MLINMTYYDITLSSLPKGVYLFATNYFSSPAPPHYVLARVSHAGGAVVSWLVRSSTERTVWVRTLAGDTVLCSWARYLTLTVPHSTQEYKWVPANCWGTLTNYGGMTCDGLASRSGGVEILLAASCYRNRR